MTEENKNNANGDAELAASQAVEATEELEQTTIPAGIDPAALEQDVLNIAKTLAGKKILVTGSTGFLAKVLVSMLLRFHADLEQLYVVIRDRRHTTAQERFQEELVDCQAFDPLHDIYGDGLADFIAEKVTVIPGDITSRYLGMEEEDARALSSTLDLLINSAGLTNFNPNLEHALTINTLSAYNIVEFLQLGDFRCALEQVSTCFVAGNTQTPTPEELPTPTIYPRYDELGVEFDVEREIDDCLRMIAHAKELTKDQENSSALRKEALDTLAKRNLDPDNDTYFDAAYKDAETKWIRDHLSYRGRDRAAHWGWPNIYTYTKSMGERILAMNKDRLNFSICRPAIVESSMSYPVKGWNEGINTSAPLIYLRYKGHQYFPLRPGNALDIIPVDYVCGGMLAIGAGLLHKKADHVYQLGSSDQNPLEMRRLIELTTLACRDLRKSEVNTPKWKKLVLANIEGHQVSKSKYDMLSAPGVNRALRGVNGLLGALPTKQMGGVGKLLRNVNTQLKKAEKATGTLDKMFEIFMPFVYYNKYTFIARNIDKLAEMMPEHERPMYGSPVASYNWREYWINVHVPGLARFSFPTLEEKLRSSPKKTYTYEDLIDLFDSSTKTFAKRVAMQHHDGRVVERYTYEDLGRYADRARAVLETYGVGQGVAVALVAENRPQWGMTYFGILKTGGVAVPIDPDASADKVARLAASCRARVIVLSDKRHAELHDALQVALEEHGHMAYVLNFSNLYTLRLVSEELPEVLPSETKGLDQDNLASLIYTSGTTGNPKGVMLTHDNFTNLVNSMQQVFNRVNERDGFLSVLPLHHTFEFTCGLLMPISRGSSITYIEKLESDELTNALKNTRITALIGVPALWQLLSKKIDQGIDDQHSAIRWILKQLMFINRTTRQRARINVGPMLFTAIHKAFGGKIKYFISGGAALPADILKSFYSLGFNMYEGYGLTEAAPVLTVMRPERGLLPGSVGRALPGVEVEIKNANDSGVGEVVARGKNVMLGYLDRDEDTTRALQDGWLHTGDLGKLDEKGNLTIVGRAKEVIVTHGGKNVYPDELEELYGSHSSIAEISVVGVSDHRGTERVAALVRPDVPEGASAEVRADVHTQVREWFRVEGSRVASHERIQILRFWDKELPRTATRKIKRTAVVEIIEKLLRTEEKAHESEGHASEWVWLDKLIGNLSDFEADEIYPSTHFQDDLGFDSLMYVELGSMLDAKGHHIAPDHLSGMMTVGELREAIQQGGDDTSLVPVKKGTLQRVEEYNVPEPLARLGKDLLYQAQMRSYGDFFNVDVYGRANIPHHDPNIIVVANHSSHLDMGLVKYALGEFGNNIRALAAADYFYKNKVRKTYFKTFTNLLPIERSGNLETSLGSAVGALSAGEMLLIFPEGTRSKSGKLQPFRKGLGYLVATQKVNVLPIYIEGTHRALPKGQSLPSLTSRKLKVFIGKPIDAFDVLEKTENAPNAVERYQLISDTVRDSIVALRDRDKIGGKKKKNGVDLTAVFTSLNEKFAKSQLNAQVRYYFSLGNGDDQKWTVVADADQCAVQTGKPQGGKADCVVKTTPEMMRKIIQDSYTPTFDEFMNGAIKTNDLDLLSRFQTVFQL